jgi:hypothetical protein
MRDFKGMKRQRSRNRGGGGGKPQHNANRAFESNGPEGVKIRGAAQHVFEKYQQLARDALTAGDRVLGESYQQHAEHYFRVLRAVQPQRPASDIIGRDAFTSGVDIDFEDEAAEGEAAPETVEAAEAERGEWRQEGRRDERQQRGFGDQRPREDRFRDERQREDRHREERPRDERPREERQRDDRSRDDRQRGERFREDRGERRYERGERSERAADPLAVVEPQATPLTQEAEAASSPMLRSHDGGTSQAPAFLQPRSAPTPEASGEAAEPRPRARRRRAPRSFESAGGEAAESSASNADLAEEA